jgi:uncharacterized lipoprotein YddW (UPF0748 family)
VTSSNKILFGAASGFLLIFFLGRLLPAPARPDPGEGLLVGVKIYEPNGDFGKLFLEWRRLGINTAFVSPALASNPEFRERALKNGIATFIIVPIFFDAEELEKRPDLYALTAQGEKAIDDWVKFICPTREDYRGQRIKYVRNLVREFNPDGVSLDFIRYFVFWEKVYPDRTLESLPQTCFDSSCLEVFQKETGLKIPPQLSGVPQKAQWILKNHLQEWTQFKCGVIAGMVKELAAAAKQVKPGVRINVHAVPWRREDFGGAIRIIAGQDLARIAPLVDYLSPMCYHHMVLRDPAWVHSVVEDVYDWTKGLVLPSIQVGEAYITAKLSPSEFKDALAEALKPPSKGVVFWNWDALDKSPEKKEIVRAALKSDP